MSITTVAKCKAFRGIGSENQEHDAELERLIDAFQAFLEAKTGRNLSQVTMTEYFDGDDWRSSLVVARPPIDSIANIWDDASRIWAVPLPANSYHIKEANAGIIHLLDGVKFSRGRRNIKATYVGGYSGEILGIEQEVIEMVWAAREKGLHNLIGVRSRSIADGNIQFVNLDWDTSPVTLSIVNKLSLKTGVA